MNSSSSLSSLVHPLRMFRVFDRLPVWIDTWKGNRREEAQRGLAGARRKPLPIPYRRNTPTPVTRLNSPEFQAYMVKHTETDRMLNQFVKFWNDHRQIFEFAPALTDALRHTDLDEVRWGNLNLPHQHFYLAFPSENNPRFVAAGIEYQVDGAYVWSAYPTRKNLVLVQITAQPVSTSIESLVAQDLRFDAMPALTFELEVSDDATAAQAVVAAVTGAHSYAAQLDGKTDKSVRALGGNVETPSRAFRDRADVFASVLPEVMPLILNCIFYVTQRPEDATERMPAGAPERLVCQALSGTPNERAGAEQVLADCGFAKVRFVCNTAVEEGARVHRLTGRTLPTHWRRGHWRRVAHGEGRSLRTWRFFPPVLVNAEAGNLEHGTIHAVAA